MISNDKFAHSYNSVFFNEHFFYIHFICTTSTQKMHLNYIFVFSNSNDLPQTNKTLKQNN